MQRIFTTGIAVLDLVFQLDALPRQAEKYIAKAATVSGGGCAANAAVAISRLGGTAYLATRLGDDMIAKLIAAELIAEKVDLSFTEYDLAAQSSFSSVFIDQEGSRQVVNLRGVDFSIKPQWQQPFPQVDAVLTDLRWPAATRLALHAARVQGIPAVVDCEANYDLEALALASHIAFSRQGLTAATGISDIEAALLRANSTFPGWVCMTDGANGVFLIAENGITCIPAYRVTVVDTLAAGDIWHGAFTLALAEGMHEVTAIKFANAVAAIKCTAFGGRQGSPTRAQTDNFIKSHEQIA